MKYLIVFTVVLSFAVSAQAKKSVQSGRSPASEVVGEHFSGEGNTDSDECRRFYTVLCRDTKRIKKLSDDLLSALRTRRFGGTAFRENATLASHYTMPAHNEITPSSRCDGTNSNIIQHNVNRTLELRSLGARVYDTTIIEAYSSQYIIELEALSRHVQEDIEENIYCNDEAE